MELINRRSLFIVNDVHASQEDSGSLDDEVVGAAVEVNS